MQQLNNNRPGYKHTPLGWIPEEWGVIGLLDHLSIANGQVNPLEEKNQDKVLIAPNHVESDTGQLLYTQTAKQQNAISGKYPVKKGDIIYSKIRPYLKKALIAPFDCLCSADMYPFTPNEKIDSNFALGIVLGARFSQYVIRQSSRTGIPKVNRDELSAFSFPLPPLPEQQKIAAILSTWDEAIAKTQAIIQQLKERNRGLMGELLRPKEGWREHRIGDLIKEIKRPVSWNDEEEYHLVSVKRRSGGAFYRESLYGHQILTKQLFTTDENDFLISKMQIVHGASALVSSSLSGMKISGSYIAARSKDDSVLDIQFFNWLSKTPWFYRLTYISSYGVHIEKMTFDFDDFKRHKILIPPTVDEQKEVYNFLDMSIQEITTHETYLATLQSQKKGLMQKLLTGEIRVNLNQNIL
jgi:type I restriction enzyme S subunit